MRFKIRRKTAGKILFLAVFFLIAILLFANITISQRSKRFVFSDINSIPENRVGLVLGTSKYLANGYLNPYFKYRMEAAVQLYQSGKVKFLVVSGDNSRDSYNESQDMKDELIKSGIPENKIYLDYAGFRTLDSVIRLNKVFGQQHFTIISQQFHNERAVFIARYYGLDAVAYNAKDVNKRLGLKVQLREKFARVKVFVDLVGRKKPRFLGEEIEIK